MMAWMRRLFRRGMERAEWMPPMIYAMREAEQDSWEALEARERAVQARLDALRAEVRTMTHQ